MTTLYFLSFAAFSGGFGLLGGYAGVKIANKICDSQLIKRYIPKENTREALRVVLWFNNALCGYTMGQKAGMIIFGGASILYFGVKAGQYEKEQEALRMRNYKS